MTTIQFYSPLEGLASDELSLMLCAGCSDSLVTEMKTIASVPLMKQRIAALLARATT